MSCDRFEELLPAYAEAGLTPEENALVKAHLRSCPGCASLLSVLRESDAALAAFPQIEPDAALQNRLVAIAVRKPRFSIFALLRKPSLQPVMVAATVLGTVASLYLLNPNRREFEKAVVRTFHRGVGRVEQLYARAGSITDSLGSYAEDIYVSLQSINPLGRDKE